MKTKKKKHWIFNILSFSFPLSFFLIYFVINFFFKFSTYTYVRIESISF